MSEQDANYRFADEAVVEPEHIARARAHALELGAAPISPAVDSPQVSTGCEFPPVDTVGQ